MKSALMTRLTLVTLLFIAPAALADKAFIGKVYHPYVLPLEKSVEWRLSYNEADGDNLPTDNNMTQRFAFGHWLTERTTMGLYALAERTHGDDFRVTGYELETRWMITDQGEYSVDWGALFAVQQNNSEDEVKVALGLLAEKEFGRFSTTANLFLIHEIDEDETSSEFRLQHRYRWHPQIQPGIDLFIGDDFVGMGPSFMGIHRFVGQKQIKWEAGFIFGLDNETADRSFRLGLEYEF